MIKIDKAVPLDIGQNRQRYPFVEMEVGDSFLITEYKKAESARIAALLFVKRKSLEWKFCVRKSTGGWRVFRVN
jgi:hypothetical protein